MNKFNKLKKTFFFLTFCLAFLSNNFTSFGQAGTSILYQDQFGTLTLDYVGILNGKHCYLGNDGTRAKWNTTLNRWDLLYNNDTETLYYTNVCTSMNPPNLSVGNWQIGPNSGMALIKFEGTGTTSTTGCSTCTNPTAYTVIGTGSYCSGGSGLAVGLANSESGVTYQLKNASNANVGSAVNGSGSAISFGNQTAGTYTVVATRTTGGCTATMTGSAVVTDKTITNTGVNLLDCPISAKQTNTISNYTVPAGNNRLLVVTASDGLSNNITGVTYNGQSMTKQSQKTDNTAVDAIFTLVLGSSASSTTGNIVITSGNANHGAKFITANSFYNVDQTTPVNNFMQNQNTTVPSVSSSTLTSAVGDMVFSIFDTWRDPSPTTFHTAGSGMIVQNTDNFSFGSGQGFGIYSTALKVGANSVTTGWTTTNHLALIEIAFNIKQAVSCTNPTAYNVTGTGSYCPSQSGAIVGLSNSETGVTYQLKNASNANVGSAVNGSGSAISFGIQPTGTYTIVATRTSGGCTATMTGSAVVTANSAPSASVAVTNNCGNSVLNLTTNGTSFLWSNGTTTEDITVSTGGTYTVTVTNAGGCTATASETTAPIVMPIVFNVLVADHIVLPMMFKFRFRELKIVLIIKYIEMVRI